jgi:hypothetical protein
MILTGQKVVPTNAEAGGTTYYHRGVKDYSSIKSLHDETAQKLKMLFMCPIGFEGYNRLPRGPGDRLQ